jgi:RNA polymerase sigma factor (TIGR02999 family)
VTAVLAEAARSDEPDRALLDRLVPLVYDELRRMARRELAGSRRRLTLDTTALVHEAYVKLVDSERAPLRSRAYFFGAAARAMRQVLVDAARRRNRLKRGGGETALPLDAAEVGAVVGADAFAVELLALDAALERLAKRHPRPARVLECHYFAGLDLEEVSEALHLARRTVQRDLAFARAWVANALGQGAAPEGA